MSQTGNHERVLEELKSFIGDTKTLIDRVMKLRNQCKEMQMTMLHLYNPKCVKILEISNEVSRQATNARVRNENNVKTKFFNFNKCSKPQVEMMET